MKRIIIVLTAICFLVFPFQTVAKASTGNVADYKEFDSFMKRYHEHSSELYYALSVAYDSNEHYFKESMDDFRAAVRHAFDTDEGGIIDRYLSAGADLLSKPVSLFATATDLTSALFDRVKGFFSQDEYDSSVTVLNGRSFHPPDGYYFKLDRPSMLSYKIESISFGFDSSTPQKLRVRAFIEGGGNVTIFEGHGETQEEIELVNHFKTLVQSDSITIGTYYMGKALLNFPNIYLVKSDTLEEKPVATSVVPPPVENVINNIINSPATNYPVDYQPTVQPKLVCPSMSVNLDFNGTSFSANGQPIALAENETTVFNNENCSLDFSFPEIVYHEETNKLLVGGEDLTPGEVVNDYDMSVIEYLRNSYQYAVSVVNTGVNGLRSIVSGTSGLITFTGSMFAFLPPEILTLFIGGFSVALGLWVFKK